MISPSGLHLRTAFAALALAALAVPAAAQDYSVQEPRRQFVSISVDWINTEPLHFASHPLEDLVGRDVVSAQGWGLGSQAFLLGGVGRIKADGRDGTRMFAEGGGGLNVGPLGVQLAVKFAWNRMTEPVEHRFLTIPITLRCTLSF